MFGPMWGWLCLGVMTQRKCHQPSLYMYSSVLSRIKNWLSKVLNPFQSIWHNGMRFCISFNPSHTIKWCSKSVSIHLTQQNEFFQSISNNLTKMKWGFELISIHLTQWDEVLNQFESIWHNVMRFWIHFNPSDKIKLCSEFISTNLQIVIIHYLPRSESVAKARSISCVLCSWFWLTIRNGYD